MNQIQETTTPAGFWLRLSATLLDIAFVGVVTAVMRGLLSLLGFYSPMEATFIGALMVYLVAYVVRRGQTVGKSILGLRVVTLHNSSPSLLRTVLREIIGKALSGLVLFLGFLFAAFSKSKRGWHDYIAGTAVVQNRQGFKHSRFLVVIVLCLSAALPVQSIVRRWIVLHDAMKMSLGTRVVSEYSSRNPQHLTELKTVSDQGRDMYSHWLLNNSMPPENFIINSAKKHQLVILGEKHHVRENLLLLKRIIPDLYHKAGVTRIGLEVCVAEDNDALAKLVTAKEYNLKLALQIARHEGWKNWGGKEYWDILEAVWKFNSELPDDSEKMLVFGLDREWDLPSLALAGVGDNAVDAPIWERLRAFRIVGDLPLLLKRDEIMARNVEKEVFNNGKRAVVLIGGNHAFVKYRQPSSIKNGKIIYEWARMGFLLHHRYGDDVYQIDLHGTLPYRISRFMEKVIANGELGPLGFEVPGSPFETLRDGGGFSHQPGVSFGDLTLGYVFIKPRSQLTRCQWLDGYISQHMFLRDKPYYDATYGRDLANASEANQAARQKYTEQ